MSTFHKKLMFYLSYITSFQLMVVLPALFLYYHITIHNDVFVFVVYWSFSLLSLYGLFRYGLYKPMTNIFLLSKSIVKISFYIMMMVIGIQFIGSAALSFTEPFWFYELSANFFEQLQFPPIYYWMMLISVHSLMCIITIDYGDIYSE